MSAGKHHVLPLIILLGAVVAFSGPIIRSVKGALHEVQGSRQADHLSKRHAIEREDNRVSRFLDEAGENLKLAAKGKFLDRAQHRSRQYTPAFSQQTSSSYYRDIR